MRKFLLAIVCIFTAIGTADGQTLKRDNLGFLVVEKQAEGVTLFSAAAATEAEAVETGAIDPALTYDPLPFDLEFILGVGGNDNSEGIDETAVWGASLKWLPTKWVKFGPQVVYADETQSLLDFSLPVVLYVFPDPASAVKPFIEFNPGHYTVAASGDPLDGHWSFQIDPAVGVEVPMGSYFLSFRTGLSYIITELNDPINDFGGFNAAAKVGLRLGR